MDFKKIYAVLCGFLIGVFLASLFTVTAGEVLFMLLLSGCVFAYGKLQNKGASRYVLVLLFVVGLGTGVLRFEYSSFRAESAILDSYLKESAIIEGIVSAEADVREAYTRLIVWPEKINDVPLEGAPRILIYAEQYPEFDYGDRVSLNGVLQLPENFETEQGRVFDYVSYLKKDNIRYQIFYPEIVFMNSGEGNVVVAALFNVKQSFIRHVSELIPEPASALLSGLLVGARRSLGSDLLEDFRTVGLIHIVVLSGYNITLVAESIMSFFGFAGRRFSFIFGTISVILFAIMTGGSATVIRASFMALLVVLAKATGRLYSLGHALLIAGFFMVLHNPSILVFDPSFELSFMATFALFLVAPILEPYFSFVTTKFNFREIVTATLSTQLFVTPFLLWMTGQMSLVAPMVNLLVLAVIPATMLFGFIAGTLSFISNVLAAPFAFITYGLLSYVLFITETASNIPFAAVTVTAFPFFAVVLVYSGAAGLYFLLKKKGYFQIKTGEPVLSG